MLAPIYLDEEDKGALERTRKLLWSRNWADALLQCMRVCYFKSKRGVRQFKEFRWDSEKPWAEGDAFTVRMSEEEIERLDEFAERLRLSNRAEAVRVIIRFGAHHFAHEKL